MIDLKNLHKVHLLNNHKKGFDEIESFKNKLWLMENTIVVAVVVASLKNVYKNSV